MSAALYDIPLTRIDGSEGRFGDYAGKVLLVVNVASKCGLTPQYAGLEALYQAKKDQGLEILGFPANNFRGQEPGSEAEIASFCSLNYGVTFPMFAKISVTGPDRHPLYDALVSAWPEAEGTEGFRARLGGKGVSWGLASDVLWNFEKFLIGRDGTVLGRFSPDMAADDARLLSALEAALAQ